MGCANHKGTRIIPRKPGQQKLKSFKVAVEIPDNNELVAFSYATENDELPIMQILNGIAFDEGEKGEKFDGNFISVLNPRTNEFEYYIERLIGVSITNDQKPKKGKVWVPYINNKQENWSYLCENNRIVAKEDEIMFKFEDFQGPVTHQTEEDHDLLQELQVAGQNARRNSLQEKEAGSVYHQRSGGGGGGNLTVSASYNVSKTPDCD